MDMKLTKIPSVDQVFDAAAEPSKKVIQMRDDLETAISTVCKSPPCMRRASAFLEGRA